MELKMYFELVENALKVIDPTIQNVEVNDMDGRRYDNTISYMLQADNSTIIISNAGDGAKFIATKVTNGKHSPLFYGTEKEFMVFAAEPKGTNIVSLFRNRFDYIVNEQVQIKTTQKDMPELLNKIAAEINDWKLLLNDKELKELRVHFKECYSDLLKVVYK